MEFNTVIQNRRSIRKFSDYYVSDEELNTILETVRWTPSWANSQTWRFYAVRSKEIINKISEAYSPNNGAIICSRDASLLIVACYEKNIAGFSKRTNTNYNDILDWGMFDLGAACQNLSLKIHEMGLGSVIIGAYNYEVVRKLIAIPDNIQLAAVIAVGKPLEDKKTAPKRKEVNEILLKTIK